MYRDHFNRDLDNISIKGLKQENIQIVIEKYLLY